MLTEAQQIDNEIEEIIVREGGWRTTNNMNDRGGLTNAGMTWGLFSKVQERPGWPYKKFNKEEFAASGLEVRNAIMAAYRVVFYEDTGYSKLPNWLRYLVVDFAVTSGAGDASEALQTALNRVHPIILRGSEPALKVDGQFGKVTQGAVFTLQRDKYTDLVNVFTACRVVHHGGDVISNPEQATNLNGWLNRTMKLRKDWGGRSMDIA